MYVPVKPIAEFWGLKTGQEKFNFFSRELLLVNWSSSALSMDPRLAPGLASQYAFAFVHDIVTSDTSKQELLAG